VVAERTLAGSAKSTLLVVATEGRSRGHSQGRVLARSAVVLIAGLVVGTRWVLDAAVAGCDLLGCHREPGIEGGTPASMVSLSSRAIE
jgi:hypothetical protein